MKKKLHPRFGFETLAVHSGSPRILRQEPVPFPFFRPPLMFLTMLIMRHRCSITGTGFHLFPLDQSTVAALEEKLATLEGGRGGT